MMVESREIGNPVAGSVDVDDVWAGQANQPGTPEPPQH